MTLTRRSPRHAWLSDDPVADLKDQLPHLEEGLPASGVSSVDVTLNLSTSEVPDTFAGLSVQVWLSESDLEGDGEGFGIDIGVEDDNDPAASVSLVLPVVDEWVHAVSERRGATVEGPQKDQSSGQTLVTWILS